MAQTKITVDGITDLTSSATELNYVDITTLGTAQASKVLTVDANVDVGLGLRNLTGTGFLQGNTLRTTVLEYTDGDDAITIVDGGAITVAQNATFTGTVTTPSVLFKGTSNSVTIDADNPAAYTVILPNAAPTGGGKVLQTASGQATILEWGTPAAGLSLAGTISGNQITTVNSSTEINGEANLTYTGNYLSLKGEADDTTSSGIHWGTSGDATLGTLEYDTINGQFRLMVNNTVDAMTITNAEMKIKSGSGLTSVTKGVAKAWLMWEQISVHNIQASFNISSLSDPGTGATNVLWDTDFSSATYAIVGSCRENGNVAFGTNTFATTGVKVVVTTSSTGGGADYRDICIVAFGEQ